MSLKVVLSGAVEGVGDYALDWCKTATKHLELRGYTVVDPTLVRDPDLETPQEIVEKNLFMQKRSDILLVEYMIPDRQYIGTDFEIAWAKANGQPVIVFASPQAADRIYLRYMATKLASSMRDAIEYIVINYPTN